jgi:hypothetical protein
MSVFTFRLTPPGDVSRVLRYKDLLLDGKVLLEARDGLKPALVRLEARAFPWNDFSVFLVQSWRVSGPVPFLFKPARRIPEEIINALLKASQDDAREILRTLRKNGFLPPIRGQASVAAD